MLILPRPRLFSVMGPMRFDTLAPDSTTLDVVIRPGQGGAPAGLSRLRRRGRGARSADPVMDHRGVFVLVVESVEEESRGVDPRPLLVVGLEQPARAAEKNPLIPLSEFSAAAQTANQVTNEIARKLPGAEALRRTDLGV